MEKQMPLAEFIKNFKEVVDYCTTSGQCVRLIEGEKQLILVDKDVYFDHLAEQLKQAYISYQNN